MKTQDPSLRSGFCLRAQTPAKRLNVCKIANGSQKKLRRYTPQQIDFFACYVIPEDAWYIIPVRRVMHLKIAVHLSPGRPKNRFFPYLEAWHLLTWGAGGRRSTVVGRR